jgi:hypothetical protein
MPNSELHRRTLHSANSPHCSAEHPTGTSDFYLEVPRGGLWKSLSLWSLPRGMHPSKAVRIAPAPWAQPYDLHRSGAPRAQSSRRVRSHSSRRRPRRQDHQGALNIEGDDVIKLPLPKTVANRPRAGLCTEAPPVGGASASCRHARASHKGRNAHIER